MYQRTTEGAGDIAQALGHARPSLCQLRQSGGLHGKGRRRERPDLGSRAWVASALQKRYAGAAQGSARGSDKNGSARLAASLPSRPHETYNRVGGTRCKLKMKIKIN